MLIYYTDWHDVDEELSASSYYGGYWCDRNEAGVVRRIAADTPADMFPHVASSNIRNYLDYTDWNDVDEDMTTIPLSGGLWFHGSYAGLWDRSIDSSSSSAYPSAASSNMKNWLFIMRIIIMSTKTSGLLPVRVMSLLMEAIQVLQRDM